MPSLSNPQILKFASIVHTFIKVQKSFIAKVANLYFKLYRPNTIEMENFGTGRFGYFYEGMHKTKFVLDKDGTEPLKKTELKN